MPTGEMMKGLVDAITNCRLYRAEAGDSSKHLGYTHGPRYKRAPAEQIYP